MSYESPYSIWNGDSTIDNWYRESIASETKSKNVPNNMLYATEGVFNRDATVFPTSSFYSEIHGAQAMTGGEGYAASRASTNKPLPALPKAESPSWEYMFSESPEVVAQSDEDMQITTVESKPLTFMDLMSPLPNNPSMYFEDDDAPSPSDYQPATPTSIGFSNTSYGFDGTSVKQETPTTSTFDAHNVIANASSTPFNLASVSPTLPTTHAVGTFTIDPSLDFEGTETIDATAGFYGGFEVEESPSPYHAPNIDDDAGFGDIRDGCENFPEQWTDKETQAVVVAPYKLKAIQSSSEDFKLLALAPKPIKLVLQPKSRIAKAARTCDLGFGYTHHATFAPKVTTLSGFSDEVVAQLNGTKRVLSTTKKIFHNVDYSTDQDEEPQSAKKARHLSHKPMDAEALYDPMPSTVSLVPDLKRKTSSFSVISNSTFHDAGALGSTVEGFPGQFTALVSPSKIFHPKFLSGGRPKEVTFGNETHPNGIFHHTRFQPGGNSPWNEYSLDFSISVIPSVEGPVGKALKLADESQIIAAETKRTVEQENLRRETHLECSIARLEGVSVGEYRYFQGHSNIEEYNEGGMCICWQECFCSKMCARYADMLCPCAKHIRFESDEDNE